MQHIFSDSEIKTIQHATENIRKTMLSQYVPRMTPSPKLSELTEKLQKETITENVIEISTEILNMFLDELNTDKIKLK